MQELFYYEMSQVFYYEMRQLLENASILLQNVTVITKCVGTVANTNYTKT